MQPIDDSLVLTFVVSGDISIKVFDRILKICYFYVWTKVARALNIYERRLEMRT
jgi:hypothetical protein